MTRDVYENFENKKLRHYFKLKLQNFSAKTQDLYSVSEFSNGMNFHLYSSFVIFVQSVGLNLSQFKKEEQSMISIRGIKTFAEILNAML